MGAATVTKTLFHIDCLKALIVSSIIHLGGFLMNEITDLEVDVKSPFLRDKPLVSGAVKVEHAVIVEAILGLLLVAMVFLLTPRAAVLAGFAVAAGAIYNFFHHEMPFTGNAAITLWTFLIIVYGGAVAGCVNQYCLLLAACGALQICFQQGVEGSLKDIGTDRLNIGSLLMGTGKFEVYAYAIKTINIIAAVTLAFLAGDTVALAIVLLASIAIYFNVAEMLRLGEELRKACLSGESLESLREKRIEVMKKSAIQEVLTYWAACVAVSSVIGRFSAFISAVTPLAWYITINKIVHKAHSLVPRI